MGKVLLRVVIEKFETREFVETQSCYLPIESSVAELQGSHSL